MILLKSHFSHIVIRMRERENETKILKIKNELILFSSFCSISGFILWLKIKSTGGMKKKKNLLLLHFAFNSTSQRGKKTVSFINKAWNTVVKGKGSD